MLEVLQLKVSGALLLVEETRALTLAILRSAQSRPLVYPVLSFSKPIYLLTYGSPYDVATTHCRYLNV